MLDWLAMTAMDRLIFQSDNCRIFHCTGEAHYIDIKKFMSIPDNDRWFLASDTNHKADTWLIYLRK